MLDEKSIKHLQKEAVLVALTGALTTAKTSSTLVAVPSDYEVKDLESYMPNRDSYRFNYDTESITDFAKYCEEFQQEGSKCFISADDMEANVIFDLGKEDNPLHQRHKALLSLRKTAAFKALLNISGERLSQKQAADFLEDWAENIAVTTKNGEAMKVNQAALQLREITIEQVRNVESKVDDFSESMSAMEKVEAKNQDKIPAIIDFTCEPYHGLEKRLFTVRLSILTGSAKPEIVLRIVKLEAQKEDIAEEFKEILVDKFKDGDIKTFIGSGR